MKLCSILVFFVEIFAKKRQIWATEHHFGEVRSDARPWLMARWKAYVRLSVHVNWTFFAIYYGFGVMRRSVDSSAVLTEVDLFAFNFYLDRVVPDEIVSHQPFLASENRRHWATRVDCILLRFLVLIQYRSVTDGRTDGQTDRYAAHTIYNACKASFVVCWNKNYKQIE